ncbi:putative reverse transcriptase domain-containing protein [Tanacetum coccineum]
MNIIGHVPRALREATPIENIRPRRELEDSKISNTLLRIGLRRTQRDLYEMANWAYGFYEGMLRIGAVGDRPSEAIDVLTMYKESQPPGPTMPLRRLRRAVIKQLIADRVAEAIAEHERNRPNPFNVGGVVTPNVQGYTHKTFMNSKPCPFNRTEGVVGLRHWIEKVEQVFEICKCAKEDKVKFAACTFEGRALIWWNKNMHTLGIEIWILTLKGDDIKAYNNRFHELALMCPNLVTPEKKKIERYTQGLPKRVKANVTSSKPASLHDAINMAHELVVQAVQAKAIRISEGNKIKWEDHQRNNNNNSNNNNNRNKNNNTHHQQQTRRHETARAYVAAPADGGNSLQNVTCYGCGEKGHLRNKYPKRINQPNKGAHGRAYVMGTENPHQNPNVVTGTFLLNDHYASILFDSGDEKSFVSTVFTPFIDIAPTALDTSYEVELTDGKVVSTNTVLHGCTLALFNHYFKIDLLPTLLASFDGERPEKDPSSLSCMKADEKKVDDIPIICDFLEVFPDDLSGLPLVREIKFRIEMIPGALPVVKSPYRLVPSEMLELSNQLKELQEKGFIRPRHSPWGAPVLFVKKKDGTCYFSKIYLCSGYRRFIENFSKIAKPLTLLTKKNKTYVWGDKQEEAFHILKEKLCNAPVRALPDGPNEFVVYYDASNRGFGCVLMQRGKVIAHYVYGTKSVIYTYHKSRKYIFDKKELNMHQRRWIELLGDYECEIKYHPGKANVVADALSMKERLKLRQVRAMSMTAQSVLKTKILEAQREANKDLKAPAE